MHNFLRHQQIVPIEQIKANKIKLQLLALRVE